MVEQRTFNP